MHKKHFNSKGKPLETLGEFFLTGICQRITRITSVAKKMGIAGFHGLTTGSLKKKNE